MHVTKESMTMTYSVDITGQKVFLEGFYEVIKKILIKSFLGSKWKSLNLVIEKMVEIFVECGAVLIIQKYRAICLL